MSGTILGIDLNGIIDRWAMTETNGDCSFTFGHSSIPPVVISPLSKGDKPLSGEQALNAIEGRGWVWPEEAAGPDNRGLCRRLPVLKLLQLILEEKKKEVEVAKGEFISISQLLASHLKGLTQRRIDTAVVAIPDTADETFQQRIVDSRNDAGFDKIRLLWRPVASLLAWGQDLATNELEKLRETKTKALVVHLDALGLEVSVLTLDVEESSQGLLLTPVRSRIGRSLLGGQFRVMDFAQELAESHSKRLLGDSSFWQMMWGCSLIWKGFLGHSESTNLFQNSKGEFVHLYQPNCELPNDTVEDFIESYEDVLEEFEASELAQVRHVIADGPFLGLTCANNQTMAAILKKIVVRGLGGRSSIPFHMRKGSEKDVVGNSSIARGAAIYARRLAQGLPTYYDFLPQLEISAIVNDQPDFVALVPKKSRIPGGQAFGPYTVQQPFKIQAGALALDFYIYKEGDQVKTTITALKEPLKRETPVELVVRQTPGQGHAIVEVHPNQSGVFGPRVLTLNWESLNPTHRDKSQILDKIRLEAGICYPDSAPVTTHEKMWLSLGATRAFEDYLESNFDPNTQISRYFKSLNNLRNVVQNKRRGSALGVRETDNQVFSVVSSDGIVPDKLEIENSWFYRVGDHKTPQQLLSSAMDKLAAQFAQCIDSREKFADRKGVTHTLFLIAAWCYSAAPEKVVEYLLDYVCSVKRAGVHAEAVSRCLNKKDHFLRFFSILESHCDSETYNHKWIKGITQILQFRENSVELLSNSQALKFTLMALNVIAKEMDTKNLKVKFLWGLQLLVLIFRYRIKRKDFLKSDSPQYAELHQIVKTILSRALEVTKVKNRKARKYVEETLKMLDYRGTNQLIAQDLASEMVNSDESGDADSEQENERLGLARTDSTQISVEESLRAFRQAITAKANPEPEAHKPTFPAPSNAPNALGGPLAPTPSKHFPPKPKPTVSADRKTVKIPLPDLIRMPLLYVINHMGGEIQLFDAIGRIAAYFDIPPEELLQKPSSTVEGRLIQEMQNAALILFREKCLERSRPGFWKITAKGIRELRRFKEIENKEEKSGQSAFWGNPLPKSSTQEPSIQLNLTDPIEKSRQAAKETAKNYVFTKIEIPHGERIKIPLLHVIDQMGGRIQITQALSEIGKYFKILVEPPVNNTLSTTATELLEKMKYAANLLWYDNCLERINSNTWRITVTGTDLLKGSYKRKNQDVFASQPQAPIQSAKSEQLIKIAPASNSKKNASVPSVVEIQIPLLQVIDQSKGQVALQDLIQRLAEDFDIPGDQLGREPSSDLEKRFFVAIKRATNLLRIKNYVTLSKPGYWHITPKGIAKLRSLNIVGDQQIESPANLSATPQSQIHLEESSSNFKSQQSASKDELQNTHPVSGNRGVGGIPSPDLIRMPLLYIIHVMGGEIELSQATERIAENFDIPVKDFGRSPFSTVEKRLFWAMQNAALILFHEKCLERSRPGFWKITTKGIEKVRSINRIPNNSEFSTQPKSGQSSHDPSITHQSQQFASESKPESKRALPVDDDKQIQIPSPHMLRMPLLYVIHEMGGEIELSQATERIAENFRIPTKGFGGSAFSPFEKKLFEAMQNSANLLRSDDFLKRLRSGFWKITAKGINQLRNSN